VKSGSIYKDFVKALSKIFFCDDLKFVVVPKIISWVFVGCDNELKGENWNNSRKYGTARV
jgi:hypothetical protein